MKNPNKEFTTEEIYTHLWKEDEMGPDVVWVYVSYLRNKLRSISGDVLIEGERGGSFSLIIAG